MKKSLFLFLIMFSFVFSYDFTPYQIKTLKTCVKISKIFNNNPSLVCTILLNETAAGKNKKGGIGDRFLKPFDRSYGVMQVRLRTCKDLIKKLKIKELEKLPDEKLLVHLIEDDKFNIAIANLYILYLKKRYNNNIKKIVIAYNSGYYNKNNKKYWQNFLRNQKIFNEFKKKYLIEDKDGIFK